MLITLPAAALGHRPHDRAARQVEAADVDPHRVVPLLDGALHERRARRRHRVVHEHVEVTERLDRSVHQRGDVVLAADVAAHGRRLAASFPDRLDGRVDRARQRARRLHLAAGRAHHRRAGVGEADRERRPIPREAPVTIATWPSSRGVGGTERSYERAAYSPWAPRTPRSHDEDRPVLRAPDPPSVGGR